MRNFLKELFSIFSNDGGFVWAPMLAGAAIGALKHQMVDKPKAQAQNRAAAVQTQFSPWTGMGAGKTVDGGSMLGSAMQGGMAGAQLGQAYDKFGAAKKMQGLQMDKLGLENQALQQQNAVGTGAFNQSGANMMSGAGKPGMYGGGNWANLQ